MKLSQFFDKVFCISLERRADRWAECLAEMKANNIEPHEIERFLGYDHPTSGHAGCSRSHRMLLRQIADGPWNRVLILEDDFAAVTRARLKLAGFTTSNPVWITHCSLRDGYGDLNERFWAMVPFLPEHWDCLYLGGGFQEPPISRLNKHIIRCGGMMTTSSYGITKEFAKKFTEAADSHGDLDHHIGPIDLFFSSLSHDNLFYVLQPRLIFQRNSPSDITGESHSYLFSMTDPVGESQV